VGCNRIMSMLFDIFNIATAAVALASAITAVTPTPRDDELVGKAYKYLEYFALVIGKAKD